VCLLVFAWHSERDHPLVVGANRDERLDRPAHALCVLRERDPRILGGRDCLAGGTWLAVNEHGVVAGLTNRPSPGGRDPTKRSRGELPLLAATHSRADEAARALAETVDPTLYNPAWLLVGDRHTLTLVEIVPDRAPTLRSLGPGVHVLENVAPDEPSAKVDRVRAEIEASRHRGDTLTSALEAILSDHTLPPQVVQQAEGEDGKADGVDESWVRPEATLACCVHTEEYGTRSSALVLVPREQGPPSMMIADGPPCTSPFVDVSDRWTDRA
jgi:uncharacterized protein with NRDE domain